MLANKQKAESAGHHPQYLLTVYFNSERTLGEQSAMGPMIDRLITYGEKRIACSTCQGEGVTPNRKHVAWAARKADYDAGLMPMLNEARAKGVPFGNIHKEPVPTVDCWRCKGACEVPARKPNLRLVTAWPTGSSEQPASTQREPDDDALLMLAAASRYMMRLGRLDGGALLSKALVAYHGRAGDWCQGELGNRIFAVATLFPDVVKKLPVNPNAALRELKSWSTHPDRAGEWSLIEARAESLLTRATRAWSEVCRGQ